MSAPVLDVNGNPLPDWAIAQLRTALANPVPKGVDPEVHVARIFGKES